MIFSPLNIEQELIQERIRQQRLMNDVHDALEDAARSDERILERLKSTSAEKALNIRLSDEDRERIFSVEEIRKICIRYRLRFLSSSHFKAEFPYEALLQIKSFEKKYAVTVDEFRIIAPDHAFELENINKDPLLFARLTDGTYFLIHKWGRDLAWYKKYLFLPVQNPVIFFTVLFACCAVGALAIPTSWMNVLNFTSEVYLRLWLILHFFIMFCGIALWIGISFSKNFSCNTWNSKYHNW